MDNIEVYEGIDGSAEALAFKCPYAVVVRREGNKRWAVETCQDATATVCMMPSGRSMPWFSANHTEIHIKKSFGEALAFAKKWWAESMAKANQPR